MERNDKNSILKSSIDFIILANSEYIIGSYNASFSDEAIFYKKILKLVPMNENLIKKNISNYHCVGFNINLKLNTGLLQIIN